jgi:hypothetical protein
MHKKTYYVIVGIIVGIVSLAHLARALWGVAVVVDGWSVPIWLSWIAFVVAGFLSYTSFRFASGK